VQLFPRPQLLPAATRPGFVFGGLVSAPRPLRRCFGDASARAAQQEFNAACWPYATRQEERDAAARDWLGDSVSYMDALAEAKV